MNSNNVEDYTWTFSFQDTDNNDSTLSVSDVKIVDNNNNKTYKSDLNGTVKLNGNSKDITVNAGGTTPDKNAVTIYYKGYSSPYIHYQVGDGNWTTAPGKAMTPDTTVDGYTHTYTIDLGTSDYANVCFNDGNNNWDSKNGQNYKFKKGTYTFKNGVITPIAVDNNFGIKSFDITPADGKIEAGDYVSMKVTLKNATSGAVSKFTYLDSNNKEYTIYDYASVSGCSWQFNKSGTYRVRVYSKESYGSTSYVMAEKTVFVAEKKLKIESFDLTPEDGNITVGDSVEMKVKLKNATSGAVSKFTYLDSNNKEYTIYDYASVSGCSWQFNKSGTYRVRVYSKESYGSTNYVMAEKTVTVAEKQPLKINQFNINSNTGSVPFCDNVNMSVNASGGKAPYQYEFAMNQYNTRTVLQPFSTKNIFTVIPEYIGNYNYEVTVKDATGATVTVTKSIYVAQACIDNLNISSSTVKVNDIVKFSADIKNLSSLVTYHDYTYTVTKDNKTETLTTNSDRTANWTPKEAGKYTMLLQIKHNGKYIAGRSIEVTVDKASENVVTIYYKGYSTPYIHYQVGNGSWTDAPGNKMTSTNEKTGYTHKYTIDLGTSTYANVCFNNGNGSWDSRNGQNYHFEKGTYTFSNGNMTKIAD